MRRAGFVWPIVLIAVGVLALLGNLGVANVSWTALLRLWPLLLVLVGIDLLFGHRSPALAVALELAVVAVAVALVVTTPVPAATAAASVPRDGAARLELRLDVGAGRFEIRGGATELVVANSNRDDLVAETTRSEGRAVVRLRSAGPGSLLRGGTSEWQVRLASDVPTELRIAGGAGDFVVDLSAVRLLDARVSTGAASLRIVLPKPSGEVQVRIDSGASSIVVEVPQGVEARVSTSGAAISVEGRTETPGYAAARDRVAVSINAAATSVTIR